MPPRTRRGAPARGGGAAAAGAAGAAPKKETQSEATQVLSETPAAPSATAIASAPSTRTVSATPAPAAGSGTRSFALKPKVVRRADDERKALAEQEEKKFSDKAAEDARRRRASRGRGRGSGRGGRAGRGRGDFSGGRDGLVRRTVAPDGPFSQVPGAAGRGGMRGGQGGFGGGGGFGSGGGRGAGGGGGNFSMVSGGAELDSRLNTDLFNGRASAGYSDSDGFKDEQHGSATDGGGGGGASAKVGAKKSLLPMGIRREEHREPEVVVATTAELEAADAAAAAEAEAASLEDTSDSELFIENSGAAGDAAASAAIEDDYQVWSRAIKTRGSVKLVGADGEEMEITDIDTLAAKRLELAAAAAAREAAASGTVIKREDGDEEMISLDSVSVQPAAAKTTVAKKPKKAAAAAAAAKKDPEDLAIEEGLQAMLHDLAMDPPQDPSVQPPQVLTIEGSEEPQEQKAPPAREGRLFLFQFPPVLPSLKAFEPGKDATEGAKPSAGASGGIKSEPGTGDDVVMLDGVAPAPIDLTDSETAGDKRNAPSDIGGGGFLGTLSIRKSGRAELSWGGMTYEMMPGTDVQFLTTAVLLEESDEKREGGGQALVGNAFGMGPVGGKYNLVPVFSEESEWTVDPSELIVDEEEEYEEEE
ncbi:hypothetical protein SBRCBS47491_007606 [Sporothrix bragantina]|uniref:Uncharacterized protein n=1 Tax=Sporothrix bragantina TaxID=671064 RepID=A0ABP0CEI3_9PEZI